ncbi:hypothetical protein SKDZ_14G2870 [Saccharomyces kudriavzevii ZP591]|nr:hypothetical protein SKDZ_14G2870 [Saccharomyces kudriavzevii ZP591]
MSKSFQEFKLFCNKVGLDFQWLNTQSPKSVPENNPSESPTTTNEVEKQKLRPATEPPKLEGPENSANNFFDGFKNAQLWNVFKKNISDVLPADAYTEINPEQLPEIAPETRPEANEVICSNRENPTMINELLPAPFARRKQGKTVFTTPYSRSHTTTTASSAPNPHDCDAFLSPPSAQGHNAIVPYTTYSTSGNNDSVPSLASSVSTSSSVYSPWDPSHLPFPPSFQADAFASPDSEASCSKYSHTKHSRLGESNESRVTFGISCRNTVNTAEKLDHHERFQSRRSEVITASRRQDTNCSACSAAAFTESNSTVNTTIPSYMKKYLKKPQNWFEKTIGKYCPLFLRGTKNIDYDSSEFRFERKMIAVQYLLLDEHSEPRMYYNPSNKTIPFWKRPLNFDTMPSYDQLLDEAERCFDSYQYRYVGFQRIEPYSIFYPWKNTQREIDLVLDHIHFSLDVGNKKSLKRKGNITLDTLDSEIDRDVRIKPYQCFPSNNLVYEGLAHPAEQSLIEDPDASLIERAYQALVNICKESDPPSDDLPTRHNISAPQLAVTVQSKSCRLLLVRECSTATEADINKEFRFNLRTREVEVTVPAPPHPCGTRGLLQRWLLPLVRQ